MPRIKRRRVVASTPQKTSTPATPAKVKRVVCRVAKTVTKKTPVGAFTQSELPFEDAETPQEAATPNLMSAIDNLMLRGRAYRLTFGGMSSVRVLRSDERKSLVSQDNDAVHMSKNLFDKADPHIALLNKERNSLRDYFNSRTIAHPEKATRLFVVRNGSKPWDEMGKEETEQEMASQLDDFHATMMERINQYRNVVVGSIVEHYDEILERARESLGTMYDQSQYASKDQVGDKLFVRFHPIPSVLPPEYNRINPEMRNQVTLYMRQQLETALAEQINDVEAALTESLTGLQERLESLQKGDTGVRFYNSKVDHVTTAITEYEKTLQALGVELGGGLRGNLQKLRTSIQQSGNTTRAAVTTLKNSEIARKSVLDNLSKSIQSVENAFAPLKRRVDLS